MQTVLVVEDDEMLNAGICFNIQNNNWKALSAQSIAEAKKLIQENKIDLVLLDVNLPDGNGFEFSKVIKEQKNLPFIFLTAHNLDDEILKGLELGADDYITKPFSLRELKARIKAVLRRTKSGAGKSTTDEILTFGTLEVDLGRREVKQQGKIVDLTPSEYAILITLCQNIGRPYSRLQLLNATLGESYAGYERAIDTHVSNLRKKIEPNPQKPVYILTVYGLGYKFGDHYETNQ